LQPRGQRELRQQRATVKQPKRQQSARPVSGPGGEHPPLGEREVPPNSDLAGRNGRVAGNESYALLKLAKFQHAADVALN
jgi:hypothetical protein